VFVDSLHFEALVATGVGNCLQVADTLSWHYLVVGSCLLAAGSYLLAVGSLDLIAGNSNWIDL